MPEVEDRRLIGYRLAPKVDANKTAHHLGIIKRVLRAEGLNRRPPKPLPQPAKGQGQFRDYDLGYVHIDVKHLPKLRTADGEVRKRYLYVAIDRCSRFAHLAVFDAENAANAVAFLAAAQKAFPPSTSRMC